jgi:hypothetical protein
MMRVCAGGVALWLGVGLFCGTAYAGQPPQADADKKDDKPENTGSHGKSGDHMFGLFPNHTTVEGATEIDPVGPAQKFKMAELNTFDPVMYPFVAFVAAVNRNYGPGVSGYFKQYGASFTDNTVGNVLTTAVLPSLLHQDPRYFERGSGRVLGRVAYAASRSAVTRGDSGHRQINLSELGGTAIAASFSDTYYPSAERTITGTLSRWGLQVMWDTLSNELKEFWPDVRRKIHHS